jgi:hypothetical protein
MSPETVMGHIVETSNRLARQDGGPTSVHAVALYRAAYQELWARLQIEVIPFMADGEEGGQS